MAALGEGIGGAIGSIGQGDPFMQKMAYHTGMERANRTLAEAMESGDEALYKNAVMGIQALYDGTRKAGIDVPRRRAE